MRRICVVVLMSVVLAACGTAGGDEPARPKPSATTLDAAANGDLIAFRCAQDSEGRWRATGTLKNSQKTPVGYVVTLYAGEAGAQAEASTYTVEEVAAGQTEKFTIKRAAGVADARQCFVRVEYAAG